MQVAQCGCDVGVIKWWWLDVAMLFVTKKKKASPCLRHFKEQRRKQGLRFVIAISDFASASAVRGVAYASKHTYKREL